MKVQVAVVVTLMLVWAVGSHFKLLQQSISFFVIGKALSGKLSWGAFDLPESET